MNNWTNIFIFSIFSFVCSPVFGQTYLIDGSPITDCDGFFLDSGGGTSNYGNNENFETVICPDGSTGTHIQLLFSGTELSMGDELCFFDGTSSAATPISCASNFGNGYPFIIQASAVNLSGCVTVTFNSDASVNSPGWEAAINCIPACQLIQVVLANSEPTVQPADTGWIDACPGEPVRFFGEGLYPQDGAVYNHSDFTSTFMWDFGDGVTSVGPNANHVYEEPGGYIVQLTIEDQFGCSNTNFLTQRVRVSTPPDFSAGGVLESTICAGDTINLSSSVNAVDNNSNISVVTTPGIFANQGIRSDTLALPDGTGATYSTSISFSGFSPGQVLTDINDFLGICVNMEHSWLFDLDISVTCPNGTEVFMQSQEFIFNEVFLGVPNQIDFTNATQGVGYDYCWTPNATNPNWTQYVQANDPPTLPSGDYTPAEPLTGFFGCPLNGEWTITVQDQWASDDGWIFQWSIGFEEDLYPDLETFQPTILDFEWLQNPTILSYSADSNSITAAPQNAGTTNYQFQVIDDFGCAYDTSIQVTVLPTSHADCFACEDEEVNILADAQLCMGDSTNMLAEVLGSLSENNDVIFEAFPNEGFTNGDHPPGNPFESTMNVNSINPGIITDVTTTIQSVCVNVDTRFAGDVEMWLRSPDGMLMELSTDNGGSADNYINTCFTPNAVNPINSGTAPFTGDWQPEGDWTVFNGSPTNGNWTLVIADDAGLNDITTILDWRITFNNVNSITYAWQSSPDLSCEDCPDPIATPTGTTTYEVTVSNAFGCQATDDVIVGVVSSFDAPAIACGDEGFDALTFDWPAVVNASEYEYSIDGGTTWATTSGALSHTVTGLLNGETVDIQIRVSSANSSCAEIGMTSCAFSGCNMVLSVASQTPPSCFNTADGTIGISIVDGASPVQYSVDGGPLVNNPITGLTAGMHEIIGIDAVGCRDTIMVDLMGPNAITINTVIDSASCFSICDGQATATATGGTGGFNYAWNTIPVTFNQTATGLCAGTYIVGVTDAALCSQTAIVVIEEPAELILNYTVDSVSCFGASDGGATATAAGGTTPYSFSWSSGPTGPVLTGQPAGMYDIIVTDFNMCSQSGPAFEIFQPLAIDITVDSTNITCFGAADGTASVIINGGGTAPFTFSWSGPAGFSSTSQNLTGLDSGIYCVTVMDQNNCDAIACITIIEPAEIQLTSTSISPGCNGGTDGEAEVMAMGGTPGYFYLWDANAGAQTTAIATGLASGSYTCQVSDATGCSASISVTVDITLGMTLSMDSTATLCSNSTDGTVTVMATGGAGGYTYLWDDPMAQTSATATGLATGTYCVVVTDASMCSNSNCVEVTSPNALTIINEIETPVSCFNSMDGQAQVIVEGGTGAGTYSFIWDDPLVQFLNPANNLTAGTYNVVVTDGNMCTTQGSVTVTRPDSLFVDISSTDVSCFGTFNGTATAMENGGVSPYSFLWSDSQIGPLSTDLFAGTYNVIVTDGNMCTAEASVIIDEPSTALGINITQTVQGCFGASQSEALAEGTGGMGPYTYQWDNAAGDNDLASGLDSISYTVIVTDDNGCTTSEVIDIQEQAELELLLQNNLPSCFGVSDGQMGVTVLLNGMVASAADFTYDWSTNPIQNNPVAGGLAGDQTYSVTVTDLMNCSNVGERLIGQPSQILLSTDNVDASCFGYNDGTASITNAQGDHNVYTYLWDASANSQTTATADSLLSGTYSVTVTDSTGCSVDTLIPIDQPSRINLSFTTTDNACQNDNSGVIYTSVSGGSPGYNYLWEDGSSLDTLGGLDLGIYTLTISDANGCAHADSAEITSPLSLEAFINSTQVTCFGDRDGRVIIEAVGGTPPYMYSLDGSEFGGASTLIGLTEGRYDVFVRDFNGCVFEDEVSVRGPEEFFVNAGGDISINLGDSLRLDAQITNPGGGLAQIIWNAPYEGTLRCDPSDDDCSGPWASPLSTITYDVVVVDENGCTATDKTTITVLKNRDVFVPTGFSPNGDNQNDVLMVHGEEGATIVIFRVYDRWGELLYETGDFEVNDPIQGWDGTFYGKEMPPGVYVWYLEAEYIDGHRQIFKGHSTLIK